MQTLVEQRVQLDSMLTAGANTLGTTHTALANNVDQMITIGKQLTPVTGVLAQTSGNFLPGFQKLNAFSGKFFDGWLPSMDAFNLRANLSLQPSFYYTRADCPPTAS